MIGVNVSIQRAVHVDSNKKSQSNLGRAALPPLTQRMDSSAVRVLLAARPDLAGGRPEAQLNCGSLDERL